MCAVIIARMIFSARRRLHRPLSALLLTMLAWFCSPNAIAQTAATSLPPEVEAALARAKVPASALAAIVIDAAPGPANPGSRAAPLLSHRAAAQLNPASVMKLVTTYAGLELLGPAYTWATPVYIDGTIEGGTLHGNLVIQGRGDPKLVVERLWLLLRRVQALGINRISGDIVLDQSAFAPITQNPSDFDGEPLRPYNALPEALLVNTKSVAMTFVPQPGSGIASISFEPPLAGVQMQASVPLSSGDNAGTLGVCGDWRGALKAELADPLKLAFTGSFPVGCGEKLWSIAYTEPARFAERAVLGLWQGLGGQLGGRVREGSAPPGVRPVFELASPTLAEVIRDINKFSNNVMAQQVFLSLSLPPPGAVPVSAVPAQASREASREVLRAWWQQRFGAPGPGGDMPVFDNGSGLSRSERLSPQGLARMLQTAFISGAMPDLMASLPIAGVDGTLRKNRSSVSQGWAHLKSGSLADVSALAGYVHTASGRRLVVVGLINHPNANAARPALDALVDWAVREGQR
jgi:serine-type D-Ala-D-Ala carboxypeptidase/endopeptidase (penicillin-binding protein 4)